MPKIQYRSRFEEDVAKLLRSQKQRIRYEKLSVKYAVQMFRLYKPDFILNNGIIIEAKGWFKPIDRVKHLFIKILRHATAIGVISMGFYGQIRRYQKSG